MSYFMKQSKFFCSLAFAQQRISHNLFLAKTVCNVCKKPESSTVESCQKGEMCSKHLATLLNCSHVTALHVMVDCPAISNQNPLHIKESLSILLRHCDLNNVFKNPAVFLIKPFRVSERIHILQEIGATDITADKIVRFSKLMKQSMKSLKKERIIASTGIVNNMLSAFGCSKEITSTLKKKISFRNINVSTPNDIRVHVMQYYLCSKLQSNLSDIRKISKFYSSVYGHSCHSIKRTLDLLLDKFQFSENKICSNGFLLLVYPTHLERILESVPFLAGVDIRECARKVPRILCMSPNQLIETEKIVKENNYSNEQLLRCLSVYSLKPNTVQQRLETIDNVEELTIRKFIPYVLDAVHSHKLVLHRLKQFQENEFTSITLKKLLTSNDALEKEGTRSYLPSEVSLYLAMVFNKTTEEVKHRINNHPSRMHGSLLNARKVIEFLLDNGVSKEQVWTGVHIVLHSINAVKSQFEKLPNYDDLQPFNEWKTHPNFVQLLLYLIEKELDFVVENPNGACEAAIQNHFEANIND